MEKISQKIALEIAERVITPEVKSLIEATKAASDEASGTFEVVITTENLDRYNEVIKLDGWETENYMMNPVVLWGHDHRQLPIGICTGLRKAEGKMIATGKFAMHEFAQEIRQLHDLGIVRATSVGFIEKEREGNLITKAELIEFSFVSVPANPYCLTTLVKSGISVNGLVTKGILNIEVKDNDDEEVPPQDADEGDDEEVPADDTPNEEEEAGSEEEANEDGADDSQDDAGDEEVGEDVKSIKEAVKTLKTAILAFEVALKEAPEGDEAEQEEQSDDQGSEDEDPNETPDQKALRLFKEGRRLMQLASTALAESLAEARKHVNNRR